MATYTSNVPLNSLGAPAKSFLILLANWITVTKSPILIPKLIAASLLGYFSVDRDGVWTHLNTKADDLSFLSSRAEQLALRSTAALAHALQ
jgi:hypothetical protein